MSDRNSKDRFYFIKRAYAIYKAIKFAHKIGFSRRQIFWNELRPKMSGGGVAAYPDAFMMLTMDDYNRAVGKVNKNLTIKQAQCDLNYYLKTSLDNSKCREVDGDS